MKKALTALAFMLLSLNILAQDNYDEKIAELYDKDEFETIIKEYAAKDLDYSTNSLYYIGVAYHMLGDDENCIKYMDLSMEKDSSDPRAYYIKASSMNYLERFEEAIPLFQRAIVLESDKDKIAGSYGRLGYSYYSLKKYDQALEAYNKATEMDKEVALPYVMIAQIYSETNQQDKALEAYYRGKENAPKEAEEYSNILFNIGLLEQMKGNYDKAFTAYNGLIELNPNDYHAYAKLIQIHYHNKEYDKAVPLKNILYKAHKENALPQNMEDMFCIDQFKWEDKQIRVFERYEEGDKNTIYNKIIFYIINKDNEIENYTIQTEYSPAAVAFKEGKYMLCASKGYSHINYGYVFDDNTDYETIKSTAIKMMEKDKEHKDEE